MSRRALVFLALFLVVGVISLQTGRRLFFSLAYLLAGTLIFSFIWSWLNLRWVGLSRVTQSLRAQVGRPVEERIVVRNNGWLPKLWLEVRDGSELPDHHVSRVVHGLGGKQSRSWTIKTNARHRGRFRLGPMQLLSGDPFGLFNFRRDLPQSSYITIFPATYDLEGFAPPVGRLMGGESLRRRTYNITTDFAGVRDYVPGDTFNRIHWRSSARTGRLIVKEFEEDPTSDVWMVLDMHRATHVEEPVDEEEEESEEPLAWLFHREPEVPPSTTDYVVTVAASIMKHFLGQNRAVGMIAHAAQREIMQPDRGLRPLTRALEHLAVLQAEGRRTLGEVLTLEESFFTRGMTVVVITSSPSTAWVDTLQELRRRGIQIMAVLVDPSSFDPEAASLDYVRASLSLQSVPTYMVARHDSIPDALSRPV
jgi:uncharacterized protein (DUF58 family)